MSFGGYVECMYLFKVKLNEYDQDRTLQSTFCALSVFGTIHNFIPKPLILLRLLYDAFKKNSRKLGHWLFSEILLQTVFRQS